MSADFSLNLGGRLVEFSGPQVMGILNVTPDSFYAGSRISTSDISMLTSTAHRMVADGASMLDLGGYSSRPGADEVSEDDELKRLLPAVSALKHELPEIPLSIDTFRAEVAYRCIEAGADIVNDISGGELDAEMWDMVAQTHAPYVLMHMRGTPGSMQSLTEYSDVTAEVLQDLAFKADTLRQKGVCDIIIDPGFGFAKTLDQNYRLLSELDLFKQIGAPVLAGMSRKSMVTRELGVSSDEALNGTTALNMIALLHGAAILRVHDVRQAAETIAIYKAYRRNLRPTHHEIYTRDTPSPEIFNF